MHPSTDSPTAASRLRGLFSREENAYEGADIALARRFAPALWGGGLLLALVLLPFFPPTRQVGAWGWAAPVVGMAATGAAITFVRRHPERVSYDFLYAAAYVALAQLGVIQWLAGGRSAPYHELLLLLVIGNGVTHPPRRFAPFLACVVVVAFAPLAYAPGTSEPGEIATQLVLWTGLGTILTFLMKRLRAQRAQLASEGEAARLLARVDPLTGLGNRRAFDEALELEIERTRRAEAPLSLLIADLNGFKEINDLFGHPEGDRCLRSASEALRSAVRMPDGCFRWGGDEFAVLLPGADVESAVELSARLQERVAETCAGPGGGPLTMTCGHAELEPGMTASDLVAAADHALLSLKSRRGALGPA